ncbi:MAG: adenylate/guanylate cyclase domain-containing protein [Bacteroidota bacterium]
MDTNQPDSVRAESYSTYILSGLMFPYPDSANSASDELIAFGSENKLYKRQIDGYRCKGIIASIRGLKDLALANFDSCIAISERHNYFRGSVNNMTNKAIVYKTMGDYSNALNTLKQCLIEYEEMNDQLGLQAAHTNIGLVYSEQLDYPSALKHHEKALQICQESNGGIECATPLLNIGNLYGEMKEHSKALDYFFQSLNIYEKEGDLPKVALVNQNIGNLYFREAEYDKAIEFCEKSIQISEQIGNKDGKAKALSILGHSYHGMKDFTKAIEVFTASLQIFEQLNDPYNSSIVMAGLGAVYQDDGNYLKSLEFCKSGYDLAKSIGAKGMEKNTCECLYLAYKSLGDYRLSLKFKEEYQILKDSSKTTETAKKLQRMEFDKELLADSLRNEEERHVIALAHQEEVAEKDRTRNMLIGGGLLLLLLAGGLFSRNRYVNRSRRAIQVEKDRSEELLLNILPEEVAEELKEKGEAEAQLIDEVTVLFTDFKGFTAMSERLSPKELVNDLNLCFSEFDRITAKYGIEKIKTIGDAYMAAGGLPTPNTTHASDVIKAALEMRDFVEAGKAKKMEAGLPYFEIRIGVHTGPVVAGIVGVKKFQYDIWGDTVNTASRMESSGEVGKVNISEATFDLVKNISEFDFKSRGKVKAKGKGEMEMYFIENE